MTVNTKNDTPKAVIYRRSPFLSCKTSHFPAHKMPYILYYKMHKIKVSLIGIKI